ncbi:MAG: histidine kinase [Brevibacillus sp.]|jgi:two-component system sporulation sensor kinase B|nr:histidine kinase [Brevibacillus sp.]
MLSYFKDFLLNIFIIFSPLLFYPYIYKYKAQNREVLYNFFLYILFAVALVLAMSFPVNLHGLLYDFRSIPLILGSLYGGPIVSLFLYVTVASFRFAMESPYPLIYLVSVIPSFAFVLFLQRGYHARKLYQKILMAILLCTSIKLIIFSVYLSLTNQLEMLFNQPITTLETYLLQALIIGVCVYLIEFLNRYYHMQEEMIRSEKSKIVSEMAAAVAHEIRNPLTTVRGFIQLFGTDDLDKQKREFYQKICLEELDRAQLIITDYLSLAKPDPEIIETITINDEINYLSNVLLTYANYNNIQINRILPESHLLRIVGDRYKFRQALINIGKNAIEALPDGGILEMQAACRNDQAVIIIRDNGIGMTPEQIKRLGTPYYSTKEKGTGLGTMVSFGIIKKMNGKIEITSELGVGTEYTLIFPRVD